jgi:hypothetical protein
MKMKRRIAIIPVLLLAALVVAGCVGAPKVYDKSVPPEQSSTIRINNGTTRITSFDGKSVKWGAGFTQQQMVIPAGKHSLSVYIEYQRSTGSNTVTTSYGTVTVENDFLPGHTYFIGAAMSTRENKIYGKIIDETALNQELPTPNPTSPNASPLEGIWVNIKDEKYQIIFAGNEYFLLTNGNYLQRGNFSFNGKNGTITLTAFYSKGKWTGFINILNNMEGQITYNGTTLTDDRRNEFKRAQ